MGCCNGIEITLLCVVLFCEFLFFSVLFLGTWVWNASSSCASARPNDPGDTSPVTLAFWISPCTRRSALRSQPSCLSGGFTLTCVRILHRVLYSGLQKYFGLHCRVSDHGRGRIQYLSAHNSLHPLHISTPFHIKSEHPSSPPLSCN